MYCVKSGGPDSGGVTHLWHTGMCRSNRLFFTRNPILWVSFSTKKKYPYKHAHGPWVRFSKIFGCLHGEQSPENCENGPRLLYRPMTSKPNLTTQLRPIIWITFDFVWLWIYLFSSINKINCRSTGTVQIGTVQSMIQISSWVKNWHMTFYVVCEPNVVQLQAHHLGILLYKFREEFDLHGTSMGLNPEGFGSNLSRNISPDATKFFTHVLTYRYVSRFYEQSSEWAKLMTINSTAQPIETHRKLAGIFP